MYNYTACPQCHQQALLSTYPVPHDPSIYTGRCLYCGAKFSLHPVEPVTQSSTEGKG